MSDSGVIAVGNQSSFRQQLARALEVDPERIGWVQSATAAEELLEKSPDPVDAVVLSPDVKDPDALGLAEFVARTAPTTAVVMVRDHDFNGMLPVAMRAGVRDVVDLTKGNQELRDAVARAVAWAGNVRAARQALPAQRGSIISTFSSKGGTGKTFLVSNLGVAIAQETARDTALVDLDVDMGDVFTYFGREPARQLADLMELGEGARREVILDSGIRFVDHVWGYGAVPDPAAELPAGETVGKFLRALRANFAYVVVDASADYTDVALAAFELSDFICLITGLDIVSVRHLAKAIETLVAIGLPREKFRVVLNRADSKVGLEPSDVARVLKIDVDAMIPSSRLVPTSLNKGSPVVLDEPKSDVSKSLRALARTLTSAPVGTDPWAASPKKSGWLRKRH